MHRYVLVLIGGGAGALARYIGTTAIMQRYAGVFPLGTFIINVTGSFGIGLVMTLMTERLHVSANWRLFLVTGFLGGYTTFSSFEYEVLQSVRQGSKWIALINAAGSVLAGYIAVWLGVIAANWRQGG